MNGETEDIPVVPPRRPSRFLSLVPPQLVHGLVEGLKPRMPKKWLALIFLAILALTASIEFLVLGLARRTFIFYTSDSRIAAVEERMLRVSRGNIGASRGKPSASLHREIDITRYIEEALLGPVSPNFLPLFPRETRLLSLLYRDGVVYADLSEDAALPPLESPSLAGSVVPGSPVVPGGEVFTGLETLYSGIKRNFPFVRDVRFFIAGKAAYSGKFR